jgi:hypothetical protein
MSGAFIGDESTPVRPRRLTNYDFARPGGELYHLVQRAVDEANKRIAPAVISDRFGLEFRGRWGTFQVRFLVSDQMLDRAYATDWLSRQLESLMDSAIQTALRDLVRTEMRAEIVRVEGAQEREWRKVEREYTALLNRVAALESSWWRRFRTWLKSLGRFDA